MRLGYVYASQVSDLEDISYSAETNALLAAAAVGPGTRGRRDDVGDAVRIVQLSPIAPALIFHGYKYCEILKMINDSCKRVGRDVQPN